MRGVPGNWYPYRDPIRLIWAKSLSEGLRQLEPSGSSVDIVLLDLGLSDSRGSLSYAFVRECAHRIPVVVLTGDNCQETKDSILASGVDQYLLKQTISGRVLFQTIEAVLKNTADRPAASPTPTESYRERVLLIEDDEEAMLLIRFALQEYGQGKYCFEWMQNLNAGINRVLEGGVDIVLLDLGLPDSSGPTGYLKLRDVAPEVPVLVLTGNRSVEMEFALLASGGDDYLEKPLTSGSSLLRIDQRHPF